MTYSIDLRKRVVAFVEGGGSKMEAARLFGVARKTVYNWLEKLEPAPLPKRRRRKLDWEALAADVKARPDTTQEERALAFGVHANAIWYALKEMGISYKKKPALRRTG